METRQKLDSLLDEVSKASKVPKLSKAARDVDKIIELLSGAREQIASGKLLFFSDLPMSLCLKPLVEGLADAAISNGPPHSQPDHDEAPKPD
jgi:hypothetical protein